MLEPLLEARRKIALEQHQAAPNQKVKQILALLREQKKQTVPELRRAESSQKVKQVQAVPGAEKRQTARVLRQAVGKQKLRPLLQPWQAGFAQREPRPRRTSASPVLLRVLEALARRTGAVSSARAAAAAADWAAPTGARGLPPGRGHQKRRELLRQGPPTCW